MALWLREARVPESYAAALARDYTLEEVLTCDERDLVAAGLRLAHARRAVRFARERKTVTVRLKGATTQVSLWDLKNLMKEVEQIGKAESGDLRLSINRLPPIRKGLLRQREALARVKLDLAAVDRDNEVVWPVIKSGINPDDLFVFNELGRGACASVRRALHAPSVSLVAVKVVAVHDESKRRQLLRELSALHQFKGDHIVAFHGAYTKPDAICAVLEFMDGKSVHDAMQAMSFNEEAISVIAHGCVAALAALHAERQLHRDVKPSNILLDWRWRVKLSDFGVSRAVDNTLGIAQTYVGTLAFMAPERIVGADYSFPSDLWSFGLCLATMALGRIPLPQTDGYWAVVRTICDADPPRLDPSMYDPDLCNLTQLCLARPANDRPTAASLLNDHAFVQRGKSVLAKATSTLGTPAFKFPVWHRPMTHDLATMATKLHAWRHDSPPLKPEDLATLADQLHLPLDDVYDAFTRPPNSPQSSVSSPTKRTALKLL